MSPWTGGVMTEQQGPQPGWYRDIAGTMRWWDGSAWTSHVAPTEAQPPAVVGQFLPTSANAAVGGDVLPRPASVTSTSTLTPTLMPIRPAAPSRNARGGVGLIVVGLAFLAVCALTFALAQPHGGIVWTGAGIVGVVLILRGFGEMAADASRTRQRLHGAATQLADPWAAHHAAKARARAAGPSSRSVPTPIVVLCLALPVALVVGFLAVQQLTAATTTAPVAASNPTVKPAVAPKPTTKATAKPVPTGPYVPDKVNDWTPIGTNAAYARLGMSPSDCLPGTSCSIIKIASRTSCAKLAVHVVFLNSNHARSSSTTLTLTGVRAGHGVRTRLTTHDRFAWNYDLTSARCS